MVKFFSLPHPSTQFQPFFSSEIHCKSKAPSKVKEFIWLAANKGANTNDLLQVVRPFKALSLDRCILCLKIRESIDHLFFTLSTNFGAMT